MHQDQIFLPEHFHGAIDLLDGAHPSRKNDWLSGRARIPQQIVVRQRCRSDLVARRIELFNEVYGILIPAGSEPRKVHSLAVDVQLLIFLIPKFETSFEIPVRCPERALPGFPQFFLSINNINRPFLKFNGITPRRHGHTHKPFSEIDVPVVVDANLRYYPTRSSIADNFVADLYCFWGHRSSLDLDLVSRNYGIITNLVHML